MWDRLLAAKANDHKWISGHADDAILYSFPSFDLKHKQKNINVRWMLNNLTQFQLFVNQLEVLSATRARENAR